MVEIKKQKNGGFVVSLVTGDLVVTKGIFPSKAKAEKEAKRVATLYGVFVKETRTTTKG